MCIVDHLATPRRKTMYVLPYGFSCIGLTTMDDTTPLPIAC